MTDVRAGWSPGTVFGGYRVESLIARGGMGLVYRATQLALDRTVALKVVAPEMADDPAFRGRFEREARLAASLDHPNILPIYEAGEIDGQLFLSMRFIDGTDLRSLIARGALAPPRAASIIAQIADALDAAHSRGLIHRDVKPGNILIAQEYGRERAYLADFGLSKSLAAGTRLTQTGFMVGTLDYTAPEQVQGGTVDGRADTYALACVLFEAVTAKVPFDRPDEAAKVWAHLSEPPPSAAALAPAVTPELDAVIRRGMAKRPEDRYPSAGEFARAAVDGAGPDARFERTEVDVPIVTPAAADSPAATPARARRPSRRAAIWGAAGGLVVIVGIVAAILIGNSGSGSSPTTTTTITSAKANTTQSTTTAATTLSPEQQQAAAYHARVARIAPRIRAVFRQFPNGHDFGKASFNATSLGVAAGLRGIADNLDTLTPPQRVLVAHEALVNDLREMEQSFRSLALDSQTRDFNGARRDLDRASAALLNINRLVKKVLAETNVPGGSS